jgi:DNA repair protein RecO (recombination protein O)
MLRPRTYQTEAVIIKKTKLGEADRILTLYSIDLGKIQGVAKGIRRPRSKLAGHLELITHSQITFARGRNLDTIIGSQTVDSFLPLKNDLDLTAYALYAAELVNQFTAEHIENRVVFQLLIETMHRLSRADDPQLVLRYFELHLLETSGYRPQLQECVVCRQPLKPVTNLFSSSAGGILCTECRRNQELVFHISVDGLKTLRWLQDNGLDTALRLKIGPQLSRELEMTTRHYIRYLLEREVKSVAWLDSLRTETSSGKY